MRFINTNLLSARNIMVIGAITVILHIFLGPLYARIGGSSAPASTDTQ